MNTSFERKDCKEDWITPPYILEQLGEFDLDPCASHYQKKLYAKENWFIEDNALFKEWDSNKRIWCNPPYGTKAEKFIRRLSKQGNGIALIFARIDTKLWHEVIFRYADAIFIFKGRLKFYNTEGNEGDCAGAASALISFGEENAKILANTTFEGHFIRTDVMDLKLSENPTKVNEK
jgi:phage N-6-adenine-methyltransferase